MKKVGIVTDTDRLKRMDKFIRYLKERAELTLIVGDELLMDFRGREWDVDVIMTKTKDPVSLAILSTMKDENIPMINGPGVIFNTIHRFLLNSILSAAGIPQPEFVFSLERVTPFDRAVIKGYMDHYPRKSPVYLNIGKKVLQQNDSSYYYSQEYLEPEREYKIYGIEDTLITYLQDKPLIHNAGYRKNKYEFRKRCCAAEPEELARRAMIATGLKMCSMDIILSDGKYYVIDINVSPGLGDREVMETLATYLLEVAR